tara:strand:- start:99 stop:482 length:384 start_codon:yes stop_codon:yes gene_type:complete
MDFENYNNKQKIINKLLRDIELQNIIYCKKIEKEQDTNKFLGDIYKQYLGFKEHLIKTKKEHAYRLNVLIQYIQNNIDNKNINDNKMHSIQHQRDILLNKLHDIHEELEDIMNTSYEINNLTNNIYN